MRHLTPRQAEVLRWIVRYSDDHGVPPAEREIGAGLGVSKQRASQHLRALEDAGYLRRRPGLRALQILHRWPEMSPPVKMIGGRLCVPVWWAA